MNTRRTKNTQKNKAQTQLTFNALHGCVNHEINNWKRARMSAEVCAEKHAGYNLRRDEMAKKHSEIANAAASEASENALLRNERDSW